MSHAGLAPKRGKGGSLASRVALLHSLAHIESWAVDLSWDIIARFARSERMPREFYDDWAVVAEDEARHFEALAARLEEVGSRYGALPAHDGLWESAMTTAGSLAARLAVEHCTHEVRRLAGLPLVILIGIASPPRWCCDVRKRSCATDCSLRRPEGSTCCRRPSAASALVRIESKVSLAWALAADSSFPVSNPVSRVFRAVTGGDEPSASLMEDVIYPEEVTHCGKGVRWFRYLHRRALAEAAAGGPGGGAADAELAARLLRGLEITTGGAAAGGGGDGAADDDADVAAAFHDVVRRHFHGVLKPPFNDEARARAGFRPSWYLPLVTHGDGSTGAPGGKKKGAPEKGAAQKQQQEQHSAGSKQEAAAPAPGAGAAA